MPCFSLKNKTIYFTLQNNDKYHYYDDISPYNSLVLFNYYKTKRTLIYYCNEWTRHAFVVPKWTEKGVMVARYFPFRRTRLFVKCWLSYEYVPTSEKMERIIYWVERSSHLNLFFQCNNCILYWCWRSIMWRIS